MEAVNLWRGSYEVSALWIDRRAVDASERVLALWRPGVTVSGIEGGWLVRLDRPRRLDAGAAPGLVLVERGGALLGADAPAERGTLVLPREGRLIRIALADLEPVDLSAWLHLDASVLVTVRSLAAPPVAPAWVATPDVREALGRPALGGEATEVARALAAPRGTDAPPWWGPMAVRGIGWLRWLANVLPSPRKAVEEPRGSGSPADPQVPPPPNVLQRWVDRVSAWVLGTLMQGRHGRYLAELVDMFEGGDLNEALRHAIPLGGGQAASARPAFGAPTPRADLSLHPGRHATSVVTLQDDALAGLRAMYLRAAERLLREGKVHDAVFVYAELLRDHDRAISLLERHGDYTLAAQVADGAGRPPEIRIRLWLRANRLDRAVAIARDSHSFVAVMATLQRADPTAARMMRKAWAEHLATMGDFAQATTVAWVDPTLRPLAVPWLDAAMTQGTPAGAALVALLLLQTPATFHLAKERVDALLTGTSSERVRLRMALVDGLFADGGAHGATLARPVVRALLQDRHRFPAVVPSAWLQRLGSRLREPALAHDLPALGDAGQHLHARKSALMVRVARGDVGVAPVFDVAWMDDGAVVLALGQLGVRAYNAEGRERARFDVPSTELVVQRGSARALALQRRSFGVSVTRIDLDRRVETPWHDGPYGVVAREIHYGYWMVSTRDALLALDLAVEEPTAWWRLNDVGRVWTLFAGPTHVCAGVDDERWVFNPQPIQLRFRGEILPARPSALRPLAFGPGLTYHTVRLVPSSVEPDAPEGRQGVALLFETCDPSQIAPLEQRVDVPGLVLGACSKVELVLDVDWQAVTLLAPEGCAVVVTPRKQPRALLVVVLEGAGRVVARFARVEQTSRQFEALVIGDDRGRVLAFDLSTGSCVRDVRVL
jgi:hypothetical protein